MSADLKELPVPLAEISQAPNAFEAFLDRNQLGVFLLAIAIAIGAIALVIYRGIEKSNQETAGAALNKAEDLSAYQAVVDGHTNTLAAGSAMVLLANSQWVAGKQDEAVGTLRKFIESYSDHSAIPSAKASLASKLMAQGKTGDATTLFEELTTDPKARFIAPFALVSLGDIAKSAGDLEKAEGFYKKVNTDYSESSFVESATSRMAILKAKPPVEIEPPAPAAPPVAPAAPEAPGSPPSAESAPATTEIPAVSPTSEPAPATPAAPKP